MARRRVSYGAKNVGERARAISPSERAQNTRAEIRYYSPTGKLPPMVNTAARRDTWLRMMRAGERGDKITAREMQAKLAGLVQHVSSLQEAKEDYARRVAEDDWEGWVDDVDWDIYDFWEMYGY